MPLNHRTPSNAFRNRRFGLAADRLIGCSGDIDDQSPAERV